MGEKISKSKSSSEKDQFILMPPQFPDELFKTEIFLKPIQNTEERKDYLLRLYNLQMEAHSSPLVYLHFPVSNNYLLSVSENFQVKIWDLKNKILKSTLFLSEGSIKSLSTSKNAKYLIVSYDNNSIKIFKLKLHPNCRHVIEKKCKGPFSRSFNSLDFQNKGNEQYNMIKFALETHGLDKIYDFTCLTLSQNGKIASIGLKDKTIKIIHLENPNREYSLPGHTCNVSAVAISSDRKTVVSSSFDLYLISWDLNSQKMIKKCLINSPISALSITDNDEFVVGLSGRTFFIWNLFSLVEKFKKTYQDDIKFIDLFKNNKSLIISYITYDLINLSNFKLSTYWPDYQYNSKYIRMTNDNKYALIGRDDSFCFWKLNSRKFSSFYTNKINHICLIKDESAIVIKADSKIYYHILAKNKTIYKGSYYDELRYTFSSPDNNFYVYVKNKSLFSLNLNSLKKTKILTIPHCSNLAVSYDLKLIIFSIDYKTLNLYTVASKSSEELKIKLDLNVFALEFFHSNDFFIAFCEDKELVICNVHEKSIEYKITPKYFHMSCFAISYDDKFVITGGFSLHVINLSLRSISYLSGHNDRINTLTTTKDSQFIIGGTSDKKIMVWSLIKMQLEYVLEGHKHEVTSLAIASNSERLFSGSKAGTIRIWDLNKREQIGEIFDFRSKKVSKLFKKYPELASANEWPK
ncbi:hypothetical protein SteCoe_30964 [Stentor coeruleus]|uniref:Anaphase-promoting complex subunit 4 WD40 domain-containing protein n=1 Tax=Stentor coeruleus TaxID=5963 RepID=A0A1R2B2E1_9CILI|nr:hypothetical protein SteCoe_30964 [Stentor coeruleus]